MTFIHFQINIIYSKIIGRKIVLNQKTNYFKILIHLPFYFNMKEFNFTIKKLTTKILMIFCT